MPVLLFAPSSRDSRMVPDNVILFHAGIYFVRWSGIDHLQVLAEDNKRKILSVNVVVTSSKLIVSRIREPRSQMRHLQYLLPRTMSGPEVNTSLSMFNGPDFETVIQSIKNVPVLFRSIQ